MASQRVRLPGTVVVLGVASLLTDVSSEMIYPLLPVLLAGTLGAGAVALGMIEGAAESVAALSKVVSGKWADRMPRRKPLVVGGYTISGVVRPLIGLATVWPVVLALRVADRIGKGVRTAPRDALIADVTDDSMRGRAYGLHRAMDNAGAVLGPLVATGLLALGLGLQQVFLLAAVPAALVLAVLALGVREQPRAAVGELPRTLPRATASELGRPFRRLLAVVVVFTLGNSTDAFLLLRLHDAGVSTQGVALAWSAHSALRTLAVYVGGGLSDRLDRRWLLGAGWFAYALIYVGMAIARSPTALVVLLIVYGAHYGAVEPTERALVAAHAPPGLRGAAFGWFHGSVGFAALPASALFGALWSVAGPVVAFSAGAALAALAAFGLLFWVHREPS